MLFTNKKAKCVAEALELIRKRKVIEDKLCMLRAYLKEALQSEPGQKIELEGDGSAILRTSNKNVLDLEKLAEYIKANPDKLQEFVTDSVNVKQSSLEKLLGVQEFRKFIKSTYVDTTVTFVAK